MKIKSLLIGMLACSALVACTNDDEILNNQEQENQKADKAYVMVRINNTEGVSSRANDGGLEEGGTNEHAIKTVNFYFYSADGTFVTEGGVWNDPAGNVNEGSIEWQTNVAVVLNNLTQKGSPKYVLAVLNKPSGLNLTNKSITEVQKEILASAADANLTTGEGFYKNGNNFIMTNSTYNSSTEVDPYAFFATTIDEDQFFKEPQNQTEYSANPVEIYVERLAAKTQLSIATVENTISVTEDNKAYTAYPLNEVKVSDITDGKLTATGTQLYALVYGWDLNATNKNTYLMKNVPAWTRNDLGFTWDDNANYRANWCFSPNYGNGTYPANYLTTSDYTAIEGGTDGNDANIYTLNYVNWSQLNNAIDGSDYCAENTNSKTILMGDQNFHATVTEMLVKARIVDANGNPVDLFRYDNVLYTQAAYLERLFAKVKPNVWRADDTDANKYIQISSEDVEATLVNEGDGKVSVTFALPDDDTHAWGSLGDDGKFTEFDAVEDDATTTDVDEAKTAAEVVADELNEAFDVLFDKERDANQPSYVLADHYNGGMMYYNIPIEHLRAQTDGGTGTGNPYNADGAISVEEAEYGVVRNHWYQVTVNSIKNLGTAVHDADEDIIPDESNNVLYYIAARINVLSWKVVRQSVDL